MFLEGSVGYDDKNFVLMKAVGIITRFEIFQVVLVSNYVIEVIYIQISITRLSTSFNSLSNTSWLKFLILSISWIILATSSRLPRSIRSASSMTLHDLQISSLVTMRIW